MERHCVTLVFKTNMIGGRLEYRSKQKGEQFMWKKLALLAGSAVTGYLGKKIYDKRQENKDKEAICKAEKKARERKIGKCPNCRRVIRYPDIETWEEDQYVSLWIYCSIPVYQKSGNCPDCGQAITVQGMGSSLYAMPFSRIPWEIVINGRPTRFKRLVSVIFPGHPV